VPAIRGRDAASGSTTESGTESSIIIPELSAAAAAVEGDRAQNNACVFQK
jgi:hypothetical protein